MNLKNGSARDRKILALESHVIPYLFSRYGEHHISYRFKAFEKSIYESGNNGLKKSIVFAFLKGRLDATTPDQSDIFMTDAELKGLTSLLISSPSFIEEAVVNFDFSEFEEFTSFLPSYAFRMAIPTHLGFPMGGAESFLFDTTVILSLLGWEIAWVNFLDKNLNWFDNKFEIQREFYKEINLPGPPDINELAGFLTSFLPDVLHSHGAMSEMVLELSKNLSIPAIIGFHFWTGLLELGPTETVEIRKNISLHKLRESPIVKKAYSDSVLVYVASEFMNDVLNDLGHDGFPVIHPISLSHELQVDNWAARNEILLLNAHPLKGGYLIPHLIRSLPPEIVLRVVITEKGNELFYDDLRRLAVKHKNLILQGYTELSDLFLGAKLVLVPSRVDETFGRVVTESVRAGIPVLSSKAGFIPYQLGSAGAYIDHEPQLWIDAISRYLESDVHLQVLAKKQLVALNSNVNSNLLPLVEGAFSLLTRSPRRRIGFFTMWGDQGLGNQAEEYSYQLRSVGFETHIFSFQSYLSKGKELKFQLKPEDWSAPAHADSVYYSLNDREKVTLGELQEFCEVNNVGLMIAPEICWDENWSRATSLMSPKLRVATIPHVEIVRKPELLFHNRLDATLYPTLQSANVLSSMGVTNGSYIGYSKSDREKGMGNLASLPSQMPGIRYLHVAGANPHTRKNTVKIIDSFKLASSKNPDIRLTVTSLKNLSDFYFDSLPDNITFLRSDFGRDDIEKLYLDHDISIQVPLHEGVGLGFYESLSAGCPVVSIDVPPHNEVVIDGQTGWLVPGHEIPMHDNPLAVVPSWDFEIEDLANLLGTLSREEVAKMQRNLVQDTKRKSKYYLHVVRLGGVLLDIRSTFRATLQKDSVTPRSLSWLLKLLTQLAKAPIAALIPKQLKLAVYFLVRKRIQRQNLSGLL